MYPLLIGDSTQKLLSAVDATPHQLYMLQFGPSIFYGTLFMMIPDHDCCIKM
jgi:hypothetical protein